jgi:hypothetical protein
MSLDGGAPSGYSPGMTAARLAAAALLFVALGVPARAETTTDVSPPLALKGVQKQMQGPTTSADRVFHKAGWITAFSVHVVDGKGRDRDHDHVFCHTAVEGTVNADYPDNVRLEGLHLTLGDGQNEIRFPEGFGIPVESSTSYRVVSMLHSDDPAMDGVFSFATRMETADAGNGAALKALSDVEVSVKGDGGRDCHGIPALEILPGRHSFEKEFVMPLSGRVHYIQTHMHRYAEEVALEDRATGKILYRGVVKQDPAHYPEELPRYSSVEGFPIEKGRRYVVRLTSFNPTDETDEGMALMRIYVHADSSAD